MVPHIMRMEEMKLEQEILPSRDYRLDGIKMRGLVEKREAVQQAVLFILNTERYAHIIYPFGYGVELNDLIGRHKAYIIPEIERRITEALLQDDRIISVDGFSFEQQKRSVEASFIVHTVFGDIRAEKEVITSV